jgi:hypothetical protein
VGIPTGQAEGQIGQGERRPLLERLHQGFKGVQQILAGFLPQQQFSGILLPGGFHGVLQVTIAIFFQGHMEIGAAKTEGAHSGPTGLCRVGGNPGAGLGVGI